MSLFLLLTLFSSCTQNLGFVSLKRDIVRASDSLPIPNNAPVLAEVVPSIVSDPVVAEPTSLFTPVIGRRSSLGSHDGNLSEARFAIPSGIASDGVSKLYVTDSYSCVIREIDLNQSSVSTIAGSPNACDSEDGSGNNAHFYWPDSIAVLNNYIYVGDANNVLRRINIQSKEVVTYAGVKDTSGSIDGDRLAATFSYITGIATDGTYLYLADSSNNAIRKLNPTTGMVSTLTNQLAGSLTGIVILNGYAYVTNRHTGCYSEVSKVSLADGTISNLVTSCGHSWAGIQDGGGWSAGAVDTWLLNPTHLSTDGTFLYLSNTQSNNILKLDPSNPGTGSVLTGHSAGSTARGPLSSGSVDGTYSQALLTEPRGITYLSGNIYFVESYTNMIRKIQLSDQTVSTLTGLNANQYNAETFFQINNMKNDSEYLYISDSGHAKLKRMNFSTGIVTTLNQDASFSATGVTEFFMHLHGFEIVGRELVTSHYHTITKWNLDTAAKSWGTQPSGQLHALTSIGSFLFGLYDSNRRIDKIDVTENTPTIVPVAGSATESGYIDNTGVDARFSWAASLTPVGNYLYALDAGNQAIRKIDLVTATVTTLCGRPHSDDMMVDGVSGVGSMGWANGQMSSDGIYLYFVDFSYATSEVAIRKVHLETGALSTIIRGPLVPDLDLAGNISTETTGVHYVEDKGLYISSNSNISLIPKARLK